MKNRIEVYRIEYHVEEEAIGVILQEMDKTIPFHPEIVQYRVFSMEVGMK